MTDKIDLTKLSDVEILEQIMLAESDENAAKIARKKLNNELLNRKAAEIKAAYDNKPEPFGVANLCIAGKNVKIDVVKRIEWEQSELERLWKQIEADKADPKQYIKVEYSVSETMYKTFGDNIKAYFEPARTVTPRTPTIKISDKED